jgi:hypothetical protein
MDPQATELVFLASLAGMSAIAALAHDHLLFATFFGVAMGIAATGIIHRSS